MVNLLKQYNDLNGTTLTVEKALSDEALLNIQLISLIFMLID